MTADQRLTIRVPNHVLQRIDANAAHAGETRSECILNWLPDQYGPNWADPPDETVEPGSTTNVALRIPSDLLDRIDESVLRTGLTRTEYILRWQPEYHDCKTPEAEAEPEATETALTPRALWT